MLALNDIAIPIAWPDQTARGDELWFAILKKIGVVKNLNFKVGHAAIVLVERQTGQLLYFDFGRYICPRGYGRARSVNFDPRLRLDTIAQFNEEGKLSNLTEILSELKEKEAATHGAGRLLCSVSYAVSFAKAVSFAENIVNKGPVYYGALAPSNNSCSRYVAQILCNGMSKDDARINKIMFPENIKASPTSNVVNAVDDGKIFSYKDGVLETWTMNRMASLKYQLNQLKPNFSKHGSHDLPDDGILGFMEEPHRPQQLPEGAQWLGGLGEGSWFHLETNFGQYQISKYNHLGESEYIVSCLPDQTFDPSAKHQFTYKVHHHKHVISQNNRDITFETELNNYNQIKESI